MVKLSMNNIKIQTVSLLHKNNYLKFFYGAWMKLWISISKWLLYENTKHSKRKLPGKCPLRDFQLRWGSLSSAARLPSELCPSPGFLWCASALHVIPGPCNSLPLIPERKPRQHKSRPSPVFPLAQLQQDIISQGIFLTIRQKGGGKGWIF